MYVDKEDLRDSKKGRSHGLNLEGLHGDEQPSKVFSGVVAGDEDMDEQGYENKIGGPKAVGDVESRGTGSVELSYASMATKNLVEPGKSSLSKGVSIDDVIMLEEDYIIDKNGLLPMPTLGL
ncbi:hypothetical protein V6N13_020486 [Hibiscus sabdariffa]|uniref:Uncharacterized protein n=1 Tax=Hibiscus sabdariffa TaxID=183260 RepID=A0ABR2ETL7_9ROSI